MNLSKTVNTKRSSKACRIKYKQLEYAFKKGMDRNAFLVFRDCGLYVKTL